MSSYKVTRKYSVTLPQQIEVRCYNSQRKKTMVVAYPMKGQEVVSNVDPGDGRSDSKIHVVRVSGVLDEKTLRVVAQTVYETIGRDELNVSIKTRNLASFGGGNTDPDILDMRSGDSIEVLVQRDKADYNSMTALEDQMLTQASGRELMKAAGYPDKVADAYAKAYANIGMQTTFRVKDFQVSCDIEDGVTIDVNGANYLEVRADRSLPAGEEVAANSGVPGNKPKKVEQPKQ